MLDVDRADGVDPGCCCCAAVNPVAPGVDTVLDDAAPPGGGDMIMAAGVEAIAGEVKALSPLPPPGACEAEPAAVVDPWLP